jgi:hypothetical protein
MDDYRSLGTPKVLALVTLNYVLADLPSRCCEHNCCAIAESGDHGAATHHSYRDQKICRQHILSFQGWQDLGQSEQNSDRREVLMS